MNIPRHQTFESFLSQCSVVRDKPTERFVVLSNRPGVGITGERNLELYLKYPDAEIQLESVLKKISESLATAGAPYGREIAIAALALIVETRNPGTSAVDHANRCLSDTRSARLMQSVVLPGRPRTSYSVNLGAYTIKAFNPDKLLYWAQRCKSAYPIDLRELKGWAALERETGRSCSCRLDGRWLLWPALVEMGPPDSE